ncbi:MAG: WbqC family protein [Candidatus Aenigmarchaeota archaeon]|nr:WbqC family protein [Candidatus Aenigmarchaeota archaeon]
MIIAGHQAQYLPGMRFFAKVLACDKFILVDHVQFVKKEWQNRNRIKTKDGPMWLTVPVLVKGKFDQRINEVEIDNKSDWQRTHWRSIELNYKKAPYFIEYKQFFEDVYKKKWEKLIDLSAEIINFLLNALGVDKEMVLSSSLNLAGKGTDLLIEMCKKLNADTYLSGEQSKTYVDLSKFKENNLKHVFMKFNYPTYKQQFDNFIPNLSIIDALFNCGNEETRKMLEANREFEKS